MSTQSHTSLRRSIPIIGGRSYRSARERLGQVLEALQVPEVSKAVAVAEFSHLYRSLAVGSSIRVALVVQPPYLELCVEVEQRENEETKGVDETPYLQRTMPERYRRDESPTRIKRIYAPLGSGDVDRASELLQQATAEELAEEAERTRKALAETQGRLTSVQEDLRIAAEIQQRMLVTVDRLERVHPDLDCHAYMIPCLDIGGDFYDVIHLDSDHIAVIVGDVSGKGVTAALMMATCITLLRAYCESFRAPSRIMRKVNPRLIDGNENDCLFTTLFLGIINTRKNSLTYCNAGHNPALVRRQDGSVTQLSTIHGPALGVLANIPYEQDRVEFAEGDSLLVYTDGASETFNADGQMFGVERIIQHYQQTTKGSNSAALLSDLLSSLKEFRSEEQSHDDITLVAISRRQCAQSDSVTQRFQEDATIEGMTGLMTSVDGFCHEQKIPSEIAGRLQLVIDELLVNVVNYGSSPDRKPPTIQLNIRHLIKRQLLVVEIQDDGIPFNPFALAEPDTDLNLDEREMGGLGIFLVRSLTENFSYSHEDPWNVVLLEISYNEDKEQ